MKNLILKLAFSFLALTATFTSVHAGFRAPVWNDRCYTCHGGTPSIWPGAPGSGCGGLAYAIACGFVKPVTAPPACSNCAVVTVCDPPLSAPVYSPAGGPDCAPSLSAPVYSPAGGVICYPSLSAPVYSAQTNVCCGEPLSSPTYTADTNTCCGGSLSAPVYTANVVPCAVVVTPPPPQAKRPVLGLVFDYTGQYIQVKISLKNGDPNAKYSLEAAAVTGGQWGVVPGQKISANGNGVGEVKFLYNSTFPFALFRARLDQ